MIEHVEPRFKIGQRVCNEVGRRYVVTGMGRDALADDYRGWKYRLSWFADGDWYLWSEENEDDLIRYQQETI